MISSFDRHFNPSQTCDNQGKLFIMNLTDIRTWYYVINIVVTDFVSVVWQIMYITGHL